MNAEKKTCIKCNMVRPIINYYKLKRPTEENPDGYLPICKTCLENVYVAAEPATFMPILYALDIPWVPSVYKKEYNKVITPTKPNTLACLGKYIMQMKLIQYKDFGFLDSDEVQQQKEDPDHYDPIENYDYDVPIDKLSPLLTRKNGDSKALDLSVRTATAEEVLEKSGNIPLNNETFDLTSEELQYLVAKWGGRYEPEKLITLERQYQEMCQDFDIRNASQRNYLRKMCVISLRYDEALANLDFESAKKLASMYTSITKEAGFQPIQNKISDDNYLNSVSYLVKMVESEGPIPVYDIDENPDLVDLTIKDFKLWTKNLVLDDSTIAERSELAAKELEAQDELLKTTDYGDSDEGEDGFGVDISVYNSVDAIEQVEEDKNE